MTAPLAGRKRRGPDLPHEAGLCLWIATHGPPITRRSTARMTCDLCGFMPSPWSFGLTAPRPKCAEWRTKAVAGMMFRLTGAAPHRARALSAAVGLWQGTPAKTPCGLGRAISLERHRGGDASCAFGPNAPVGCVGWGQGLPAFPRLYPRFGFVCAGCRGEARTGCPGSGPFTAEGRSNSRATRRRPGPRPAPRH